MHAWLPPSTSLPEPPALQLLKATPSPLSSAPPATHQATIPHRSDELHQLIPLRAQGHSVTGDEPGESSG